MTIAEITIIGDHAVGIDERGRLVKRSRGRWLLLRTGEQRDRRPYFRARRQAIKDASPPIAAEIEEREDA